MTKEDCEADLDMSNCGEGQLGGTLVELLGEIQVKITCES